MDIIPSSLEITRDILLDNLYSSTYYKKLQIIGCGDNKVELSITNDNTIHIETNDKAIYSFMVRAYIPLSHELFKSKVVNTIPITSDIKEYIFFEYKKSPYETKESRGIH